MDIHMRLPMAKCGKQAIQGQTTASRSRRYNAAPQQGDVILKPASDKWRPWDIYPYHYVTRRNTSCFRPAASRGPMIRSICGTMSRKFHQPAHLRRDTAAQRTQTLQTGILRADHTYQQHSCFLVCADCTLQGWFSVFPALHCARNILTWLLGCSTRSMLEAGHKDDFAIAGHEAKAPRLVTISLLTHALGPLPAQHDALRRTLPCAPIRKQRHVAPDCELATIP